VNISVTLNNDAPTISITSPASGFSVTEGTAINFTGTATDEESGNLAGSIAWSSSIDGSLGSGASINPVLSAGTHTITASVSDGSTTVDDTVSVTVNADQPPTVTITSPANGASFNQGATIGFAANATDNEDNNATLTSNISWSSDQDGGLGSGGTLNISSLSVNTHIITASVTDSGGNTDDTSIQVTVNPVGGGGTANVDGVISAGEYAGATQLAINVNVPEGGSVPGTVFIQNDAQNLYVAVRYPRAALDARNSLAIEFDSDNSGSLSNFDDGFILNPEIGFSDLVRLDSSQTPLCTGGGLCSFLDTDVGGSNDGAAVLANAGGFNVWEFAHPLNTGEATDFALAPGNQIGIVIFSIRKIDGGGTLVDTDLFNLPPITIQ
ncbi:MAG: hypothetical protein HKO62_08680, partial [Gammaproteobacteria bacterium]|nr:hypothetical protein [Gammaproteobacteria bacterium]